MNKTEISECSDVVVSKKKKRKKKKKITECPVCNGKKNIIELIPCMNCFATGQIKWTSFDDLSKITKINSLDDLILAGRKIQDVSYESHEYTYFIPDKSITSENYFVYAYTTGGASGGNCWNDNPAEPYTCSYDPEFLPLKIFLINYFREMSFINWNIIMNSDLITHGEYTENEYYGNYTNYEYKYISYEDVWKLLKSLGLVERD